MRMFNKRNCTESIFCIKTAAFLFIMACITSVHAESSIRVGLLSPGSPDNPFWKSVADFAKAVAEDLDIDLIIRYSNESSYGTKKSGMRLLSNLKESDYFLTGYYRAVTMDLLQETESRGIKTAIFNTDIIETDKPLTGKPRQKFKHWIAHIRPDEISAGYILAAELAQQAQKRYAGPYDTLAITGPLMSDETYHGKVPRFRTALGEQEVITIKEDTSVSAYRLAGLERYATKDKDIKVLGYLDAFWLRQEAKRFALKTMPRYQIKIYWVASDLMAMGVIDAAKESGLTPGRDFVVGGIDWSEPGLKAVADGELAVSMGGHFMEAGWALLLMHDYHFGYDFVSDTGTEITTTMQALTEKNINDYLKKFGDGNWNKIDFRQFSKKYNPHLSKYDFSLDAVLHSVD